MTRIALLLTLALTAAGAAAQEKAPPAADPMSAWKPHKVAREAADKKEILAVMKAMDAAAVNGDVEAAATLVHFPVLMATDDAKGQGSAEAWTREQWLEVMKPMYAKPMSDAKMAHNPTIFLVSDSLALVGDTWSMTMGKKKMAGRSAAMLVRVDGSWRFAAMMESGWGDMPGMDSAAGGGAAGKEPPAGGR
ncbi:nuclear transport factor 2 family protein [Anaeromyxobacter sp. PSR-1]|uniref:nuclear transport factor 2 family protein n=1 Tax=unclassified Anaeromyxobacter TaxID=2620896 RepID=UPI0005E3D49D|nr:nuclear transport factor 2 family protein [Anaeromyxobacter sp. PSR-1]GAO03787.1 hypothetical protein PSR1_02672 [Anaeromyxobacter sp. PSR-1]